MPVGLGFVFAAGLTGAALVSLQLAKEAREEAARSTKTQHILASVFEQADPYGDGAGKDASLADALINAIPRIRSEVRDDPQLAWEVNYMLGDILTSLGMTEAEHDAYRAAFEAARKLGRDAERERFVAIAGIGNVLARKDPAAAVEFLTRELPDSPSRDRSKGAWISAQYAAISSLIRLRRYREADEEIATMAAVAERFGIRSFRLRGRLSQLLAGRAERAGDMPGADAHWRDAVRHMRDAENPLALAVILSNRGRHLVRAGDYAGSEASFQEALAVFAEHSPEDPSHASVLRAYAELLVRRGDAGAALERLDEALAILAKNDEAYTRFVVLENVASTALVAVDVERVLDASLTATELAYGALGADPAYVDRASKSLIRLLSFAGAHDRARQLASRIADPDVAASAATAALAAGDKSLATELTTKVQPQAARLLFELRLACHGRGRAALDAAVVATEEALPTLTGPAAAELALWLAIATI